MDSDIPHLQPGWAAAFAAVLVAVLVWAAITKATSLGLVLIYVGAIVLVGGGMVRILTTSLTAEGVSQWSWHGRVSLRWRDVQRVRMKGKGWVSLEGPSGKVAIPGAFYSSFDRTLEWLATRLPHVWPTTE